MYEVFSKDIPTPDKYYHQLSAIYNKEMSMKRSPTREISYGDTSKDRAPLAGMGITLLQRS